MKGFSNKHTILGAFCIFFLVLTLLGPTQVEAASLTVYSGSRKDYTASAAGETISVSLSGAYTSVSLMGKPSWVTQSGSGSSRKITVQKNSSTSSRTGDIVYRDGSKVYTLRITQKGATPQTISVKFDKNGGYGNISNRTYTVGKAYGSLPAGPTPPTGYSFSGWYTAKSGGTKITTSSNVFTSYTTLYAHYTAKPLTVSFNSNNGSSVASKTVTYGSTYGALSTPTRTGHTFLGWYTAASGGSKVISTTKVTLASSHTLYAHWSANTYSITFDSLGAASYSAKTVTYGSTYGTLPSPTKTGHTFLGWYTAASGGSKVISTTKVTLAASHKLYAHWSANTYVITFDSVGGSDHSAQDIVYGSTYGTLPTPTKTGYTFVGWYTAEKGGSKVVSSTKVTLAASHKLYAHWEAATYTVTFDSLGATFCPEQTVTYDNTYGTLPAPTKDGYTFIGWYTAEKGGSKVIETTKVTLAANHKLYAHFVYAPDAFFVNNPRYIPASNAKTIPYNYEIEELDKKIGYREYKTIYDARINDYKPKEWSEEQYLLDLGSRCSLLLSLSSLSQLVMPNAADMIQNYFYGTGELYEYDAWRIIEKNSMGREKFTTAANGLMREMEKYLAKGKTITFVEADTVSNGFEFPCGTFDIVQWNAYFGVKQGFTGVSGSCSYDGSKYTMDLYFYIQDYYDFYYPDGDGQQNAGMFGVKNNELAFLVLFGEAFPYESRGVYHANYEWTKGQNLYVFDGDIYTN